MNSIKCNIRSDISRKIRNLTIILFYIFYNNLLFLISWVCRDKRYLAKVRGSNNNLTNTIPAKCDWYTNFNVTPADIECELAFCVNGSDFNSSMNYKYVKINGGDNNYNVAAQQRIGLGQYLRYICKDGFYLQNNTDLKTEAERSVKVYCEDGLFHYPDPWPECVDNIQCEDPGTSDELIKTDKTLSNFDYESKYEYKCKDLRRFVKIKNSNDLPVPHIVSTCKWRKLYDVYATQLECIIHHCGHPNVGDGSHPHPPTDNYINLINTNIETNFTSSYVSFGTDVMYKCASSYFIENSEIDPTKTNITVKCLTSGTYDIPTVWPNCTKTVSCGTPPAKPDNGRISWLVGTENQVMSLL